MTPYIFRKYSGHNPNEIKCWSPSHEINTESFEIEATAFHRGASKAGTSIPSPFARMELFDTAFHIVATEQKNNLSGNTIYHQLVSDCLDVMQLIFNAKNSEIGLGKKISFKEWKVKENIEKLKLSGEDHPHYLLAKSYEQVFLDQQNPVFGQTDSLFLIYYENKLLGGTSPLTLFFTSPNWTRHLEDGLIANPPGAANPGSGYDMFFDDSYRALFERDEAFVEYLYKLFLQNRSAFNRCEGLRKYINRTIQLPKFSSWIAKYREYQVEAYSSETGASKMDGEYERIITNVENKLLTVNGIYFYHQKEENVKDKISKSSDFVIRATVDKYKVQVSNGANIQVDPPLVLINEMNVAGDYLDTNSPWDPNTKIKEFYHRAIPLFERKLPQGNSVSVTYPFITTDDFLEDVLVQMRYNINKSKFYTGTSEDFKFLLPIKKEYFNFFTINDLKKNLQISLGDDGVRITLKVPIKNKKGTPEILFTKEYARSKNNIVECAAGMGIYPFYKIADSSDKLKALNNYTVLLAERNPRLSFQSLEFYSFDQFVKDGSQLKSSMTERSTEADVNTFNSLLTSKFYQIQEAFDYLELTYADEQHNPCRGLIIPDFTNRTFTRDQLLKAYTFAIDFGTSNTHIAYMENGGALPKPFEVEENDQQMVLLNEPGQGADLDLKFSYYGQLSLFDLTLKREFTPAIISKKLKVGVSYPFKTATCEIAGFSNADKSKVNLFSHINIGYNIDMETKKADGTIASNIVYTTNLKWLLENNNDDSNKNRVKFFLKQLLTQIKAKTIINNGNPADLRIVWSVPLSMERGNRTTLKAILKEAFQEVFKNSGAKLLEPIPESVAPYFYLTKSDTGIVETANVINIDIGGGTSDVMMFMESTGHREDKFSTTSFRFAGSDLWGSGFKGKLKDNGFIKNYYNYQKANNINPSPEIEYLNKVKDDGSLSADDLVSLLFRYDNKFKLSDSILIGNPNLSLVLYLHYSAIIYHITQILEIKDYPLPRYLSFTGKGSQYINLLCGGDEGELVEYTKLLFLAYTGKRVSGNFEVHISANPKEITANGAVLHALAPADEKEKYDGNFEFVHPGFDHSKNERFVTKVKSSEEKEFLIAETLAIDSELNQSVLTNVNSFLDKTLLSKPIIDFLSDFKIKNVREAHAELKWNGDIFNGEGLVYDSYKKALKELHKQQTDNSLPESLFFYALKDALYRLSKSIVEKNS